MAAGMAGLAGCAGFLGDGSGGGGDFGEVTTWLPAPRTFNTELSHYGFTARAPSATAEVSDDLFWTANSSPNVDIAALTADDVEYVVEANAAAGGQEHQFSVYSGEFDADWISTNVEAQGFQRVRDVEDVTIYEQGGTGGGNSRAVGISEGTLIDARHAGQDADAALFVETLLDANQEVIERYTDANPDMNEAVGAVSDAHRMQAETFPRTDETVAQAGQFRNQVASARAQLVEGDTTSVTEVLVFLDSADVIDRDIEVYIDESGQFSNFVSRPEYSTDGRVVTIEGQTPTV